MDTRNDKDNYPSELPLIHKYQVKRMGTLLKEYPDLSKKFIHRIEVVAIADIDEIERIAVFASHDEEIERIIGRRKCIDILYLDDGHKRTSPL